MPGAMLARHSLRFQKQKPYAVSDKPGTGSRKCYLLAQMEDFVCSERGDQSTIGNCVLRSRLREGELGGGAPRFYELSRGAGSCAAQPCRRSPTDAIIPNRELDPKTFSLPKPCTPESFAEASARSR